MHRRSDLDKAADVIPELSADLPRKRLRPADENEESEDISEKHRCLPIEENQLVEEHALENRQTMLVTAVP